MDDPRLSFFPGRKVKAELTSWHPKMNAQGEKRVRLDLMIPLIDETRKGQVPGWLIYELDVMDRADSGVDKIVLGNITLEGVTMEFFDTVKSPERTQLIAAATLQDFTLERLTRDKQTFLALCFVANVKRSNLLKWCDKYEACYVAASFTPADPAAPSKDAPGQQMTIGDAKKAAAADSDEDEGGMPDLDEERQHAAEEAEPAEVRAKGRSRAN